MASSEAGGDTSGEASSRSVSRRRRGGASLKIIKWRDIPAQVNATNGDDKVQIELPHRFQAAIDRAAMLADKKDSNSYIAEMGQSVQPTPGIDLRAEAEQVVADIEAEFTADRLNEFVRGGGYNPSGPAGDGGTNPDPGDNSGDTE